MNRILPAAMIFFGAIGITAPLSGAPVLDFITFFAGGILVLSGLLSLLPRDKGS